MASWVLAAALVLAGCTRTASPTPGTAFFFPRHASPLGNGFEARLEGVVVFADRCLWVQPPAGARVLILWPSDVFLGKINNRPAEDVPTC